MTAAFQLPLALDFGATFIWAVSGALVAARQKFDLVGLCAIALVAACGGGLMRDGLFLQNGPPALVQSPWYIALALLGALCVFLFGRRFYHSAQFTQVIGIADALSLGAFAVVGMQKSLALGLSTLGVILVGLVNAVGGGVLRDILVGREPLIFKPGTLNVIAALAGCGVFVALRTWTSLEETACALATIALTFALRAASVRFNIQTQPVGGFSDDRPV
ncbi:MAG: TRIC cation channel family protein [Planctomycetes bacterium]|nr:TRIC cation channel family protein [Planctomycetota bacterium]